LPTFVLIFEDDAGVSVDPDLRGRHVEHLKSLGEQAILGGPTFSEDQQVTGRVIVGEFATLEDARAFAAAEPLVMAGRARLWRAAPFAIVQKDGVFRAPGG
jgi:uncharacterized protein YciI